jgi:hypothetical protein
MDLTPLQNKRVCEDCGREVLSGNRCRMNACNGFVAIICESGFLKLPADEFLDDPFRKGATVIRDESYEETLNKLNDL